MSSANDQFYQTVTTTIQQGNIDEAMKELETFLKENKKDEVGLSLYAATLMNTGKADEALAIFKKSVSYHPTSFSAQADLGFAAMTLKDTDLAVQAFEKAVEINADFYPAWSFLGKLYFEQENYDKALKAVKEAEELDPLDTEYQKLPTLMREGKNGEAEDIARNMLARQPGHPRAAYFLGHLASLVGAFEEQVNILSHGLDHHPANANLRKALVEAYEKMGEYVLARGEAELLVKVKPAYLHYWILSRIYGHTGQHDKALEATEKAASFLGDNKEELGKVDLLRGHANKILGNREDSEKAYRSCLKNTPNNGAGWWGLADLKTYKFSDDDKTTMETLANNEKIPPAQRCQAAFGLGKAFENDGDEVKAFTWYMRGNALRPDLTYTPENNKKIFDRIIDVFNSDTLKVQANPNPVGPTPIFILGMPRAGSTLIEQILASHSNVEGTMELTTLPNLERKIKIAGGRLFEKSYPESMADFNPAELSEFGQAYVDQTAVYRTDKAYYIDKMPPNFERVGLIHKIMPHALIIDARRHPLDCGYSTFKQHFAGGHEYSYDLGHIGHYYNDYLSLMDHWDTVLPGKVIRVQYEDMVKDTEATIRSLLDTMGLDFEDSCLKFYENKRAVRTASAEQVRQPINTKGMGRWQAIEEHLQPLKNALGEETLKRFQKYLR